MKSINTKRLAKVSMIILLAMIISIPAAQGREKFYPHPSTQLRTGEPDGIAPFAQIAIHDKPLGKAFVYGGESPDLFIRSGRWTNLTPGIYLYKFITRKNGVPVFGQPVLVQIDKSHGEDFSIYQKEKGDVFALYKTTDNYVMARFDKQTLSFGHPDKKLKKEPFDGKWWDRKWVDFKDHISGFVTGSRYGNLTFRKVILSLRNRDAFLPRYVVGTDGVRIRNNTTNAIPLSYPNADGINSDLIVLGEGPTYYYRFTGRFDGCDQPVYHDQQYLLEKDAVVCHSSLPVINTADFDGDGDIDIVSGDSVGFVSLFENAGTTAEPKFLTPVKLRAAGEIIRIRPGYYGSLQGPGEANWGYTCPTVIDWNGDGLPDILLSDSTATHKVYLNRGTRTKPEFAAKKDLFCDGLDVHGPWRVKPGAGMLNGKMAYIIVDDDQQLHLYWKIDEQNLEDAGKLKLEDGGNISVQPKNRTGGRGGRAKITLFDWDRDGKNDMLITTHSSNSIPRPDRGIPRGAGAMVMLLKNVSNENGIRFAWPRALQYKGKTLYLGEHSCSAAPYPISKDKYGMIVTIENGRFFLLKPEDISWEKPQRE